MSDYPISEEVASDQLDLLLDYYDIEMEDFNEVKIDGASSKAAIQISVRKLTKAIRKGNLEITFNDGELFVTQKLIGKKYQRSELKYKPLGGSAKMAASKYDRDDFSGRMYAILGAMCGEGAPAIISLVGPDLSVAECLGGLFLLA